MQPERARWHWFSTERMTVAVTTDEAGRIVSAPPIVRKFVGQPVSNLHNWLSRQPGFRCHHAA